MQGLGTGVDNPNDYIFSVSASMEQLTGHLVAQTKAKEVPASGGRRRVPSASLNTNDFWKLWRVNMQDHKGMVDLLWIDN